MSVSQRLHALWARQLVRACGGLDEAAEACRLSKSRLSQCQDPEFVGGFLPADVIADLEAYCGSPIYSQRLAEARPSTFDAQALMDEAMETAERASELQRLVREATRDGHISPREKDAVRRQLDLLLDEARQVSVALDRAQPGEGDANG